jgi:hypothetical protein
MSSHRWRLLFLLLEICCLFILSLGVQAAAHARARLLIPLLLSLCFAFDVASRIDG